MLAGEKMPRAEVATLVSIIVAATVFVGFEGAEKLTIETVLAWIAILFASIQFFDARSQNRKLEEVAGSMSTRFVGNFPKNLSEIVRIVSQGSRRLDIVVDICAYGHYSAPRLSDEYVSAVREARRERNVEVRMIFYEATQHVTNAKLQFPEVDFQREQQSPRFREYFGKVYPGKRKPTTWDDFLRTMLTEESKLLKELRDDGVKLRSVSDRLPMSLWLEDGEAAVFSFQNPTDRDNELSFGTRDGNLLRTLTQSFEDAWANAKDV